mmetsp:Transcript_10678/g.43778  ORF Transcript_10678/g.43778 Transcript_10678/m.43778 type:complete len:238 (+) Transcript_10678:225-938(+)
MSEANAAQEDVESTDDEYDEEFDWDDGKQEIVAGEAGEEFDAQEVLPRLFLGSVYAATNEATMKAHGVTHVLVVSGVLPRLFPQSFRYCQVDIDDFEMDNVLEVLPACFAFIDAALAEPDHCILVHCQGGVSRSVSVVTAYIMQLKKIPFDEALCIVKTVRMVYPNEGFRGQLADLHECILATSPDIDWTDSKAFYESDGYKECMERKAIRDKDFAKSCEKTPLFEAFKEIAKSAHS